MALPFCGASGHRLCRDGERLWDSDELAFDEHACGCNTCSGALAHANGCADCQALRASSAERGRLPSSLDTVHTTERPPTIYSPPPAIPGYEILGELGEGGMGRVWQACQVSLARVVALKLIKGEAETDSLIRFRIEAESLARLHHPNVVQVYDFGILDGHPYLVMEHCPNGTLADRLGGASLPARDAAVLVEKLARAMAEAHANGIVHRDLKPGNVLFDERGEPKVTDFGLARRLSQPLDDLRRRDRAPNDASADEALTLPGAIMGTPAYMPPEQARGEQNVGPRADAYSLGAILYECLTGRPPFRAEQGVPKWKATMNVLLQVQTDEPVPPRQLNPPVPLDLEAICLKCLRKDATKRYASASELADDLRRYLGHEPIQARPASAWERGIKWGRRQPALAALLALGIVALVGLGVLSGWLNVALRDARQDREHANEARNDARQDREHANEARNRAKKQAKIALDAIKRFWLRLGEHPELKEHDFEDLRRDMLEEAEQFLGQLGEAATAAGDDGELRSLRGEALLALGQVFRELGEREKSRRRYDEAVPLFEGLGEAGKAGLATALHRRGRLRHKEDDWKKAQPDYENALRIRRKLAAEPDSSAQARVNLAITLTNLSLLHERNNKPSDADAASDEALQILRTLSKDNPDATGSNHELARSLFNRAHSLISRWERTKNGGEKAKANQFLAEAVQMWQPKQGRDPAMHQAGRVYALNEMANLAETKQQKVAFTEQAVREAEALTLKRSRILEFKILLATAYQSSAEVLEPTEKPKAIERAKRAWTIRYEMMEKRPGVESALALGHAFLTYSDLCEDAERKAQTLKVLEDVLKRLPAGKSSDRSKLEEKFVECKNARPIANR